jgi:protein-S-isoprenylcysteine O-methyltransferase Ste14
MHSDFYRYIDASWIALCIIWIVGAFTAKQAVRSQSIRSRLVESSVLVLAFLLFTKRLRFGPLAWRFLPVSLTVAYTGLVLTTAGITLAIWARLVLGRNWSGRVSIKRDHELIRNGPYAWVRHPIYASFFLALLGTAIAFAEIGGLVATGLALLAFWMKWSLEERFMIEQFGAQYAQYKQNVKALIPFVW